MTVQSLSGTTVCRDACVSATRQRKIYFNCMDPTRILNWLDMKVIFPIYVGLSGMIGVIFAAVIDNFL